MNKINTSWEFNRGIWSVTEETVYSQAREDDPRTWEQLYQQAGYEPQAHIQIGNTDSSFFAEVFTASRGKDAPTAKTSYLVQVSLPTEVQSIYVVDFPSLTMLLSQLSNIVDSVSN
jgi:hypothetical protein